MLDVLDKRFRDCDLQLHPEKTQIVSCKSGRRGRTKHKTAFDFLGYTFRPRSVKNSKTGKLFVSFTPAVSKVAKKSMRERTRQYQWHRRTNWSLEDIAKEFNPVINGWINYYGRYGRTELIPIGKHINGVLAKWAMCKYKKLGRSKFRAIDYIERTALRRPNLFAHWQAGMRSAFA